ncbi:MAG: transposase [Alphaproteobacteria bacterium]|nr:transposase [Alphaproteobacteria bacterium]
MAIEGLVFGDRRVDRCCGFLHARLVRHGPRGISVRRLGGNRAGEVRIGRFLRNGKVTVEKIVERAASRTASRVAGLDILAIQDTTSFRDDGQGNSLVGHATIAVEAEHGALLGLVDARIIERHGGGGKKAKGRALCDKESRLWLDGMQASGRLTSAGAVRVTAVADREGDIYEMFADRPEGVEVLVRAAQDRAGPGGGGPALLQPGRQAGEGAHDRVAGPSRTKEAQGPHRRALRCGHAAASEEPACGARRGQAPARLPCRGARDRPAARVTPAHWRLLTSHRVESFEQARWITQLYRRRWAIEQLFRTIKSKDFDIERVSMETALFTTLCAMTLVAGVSCMQMVQDRDGAAARPLQDVFEDEDRPALEAVSATLEGKTEKQKNPHRKRLSAKSIAKGTGEKPNVLNMGPAWRGPVLRIAPCPNPSHSLPRGRRRRPC